MERFAETIGTTFASTPQHEGLNGPVEQIPPGRDLVPIEGDGSEGDDELRRTLASIGVYLEGLIFRPEGRPSGDEKDDQTAESWVDDDHVYLEARTPLAPNVQIDLSFQAGRLFVRMVR